MRRIDLESDRQSGSARALVLATLAFAANFWAWNLLSPLGKAYGESLALSDSQVSLLVAIPVLVGSLGRIPLGALTDKLGGRIVFAALSFAVVVPVVFLAFADSYAMLLAGGFLLGIAGASFAVGVPFVSAWFRPERRGFALGIYGAGNIGVSISGFLTPRIAKAAGTEWAFLIVVVPLVAVGVAFLVLGRESPDRPRPEQSFWTRLRGAMRLPATWDFSILYAISFGGFVAFSVYLPTYLVNEYGLELTDAGLRAAGFAVLATIARPVGGWISDRVPGDRVLMLVFAVVALGAVIVSSAPAMPLATVAFLTMAWVLGMGNGAVFALLGKRVPSEKVGSVTGIVGAAGGLGGFLPPLVMGFVFERTGSYAIGLLALAVVALLMVGYTKARFSRTPA